MTDKQFRVLVTSAFLTASALLVPLAPRHDARAAAGAAVKPNIVEVMVDDMRADDLRWMPYLRRLMHTQGLEFRNSFSSFPLCCPARASFFSGQLPHNHRVLHHLAPYGYAAFDDRFTLATSLQDVGYQTGLVGKYLNSFGNAMSLVGSREAGHLVPSYSYVPHGWSDFRAIVGRNQGGPAPGDYFDTWYDLNGTPSTDFKGEYNTHTITDFAVDMTRAFHAEGRPFFVSVNYIAPHWCHTDEPGDPVHVRSLEGTYHKVLTAQRPEWVKGRFDNVIDHGTGMPRDGSQPEPDVSDKPAYFRNLPRFSRQEMQAEAALTRQRAESLLVVDTQVRRLIEELQVEGEWDNTVLIFTSDNGYMIGEHRVRQEKIRAHEPSLRVPFLITGPGMRQGQRRYDPISTVDVAATIIALAGAQPPHTPDGVSRLTTMRTGDQGWIHPVVTEGYKTAAGAFDTGLSSIGVRTPRYSYINYARGVDELYDLWTDPYENWNRIDSSAYATVVRQLNALAWKLHDCVGLECHLRLPTQFARTPAQTKTLTEHYFWAVEKRFGYGGRDAISPPLSWRIRRSSGGASTGENVELSAFPSALTTRLVQVTVTGKVSVGGAASPGHDVRIAARRDGKLVSVQNVSTSQTGWFSATVATPRNTTIVATPEGGDPQSQAVTVEPVVRVSSPAPGRLRVTTSHPAGQTFALQRRIGSTWVTAQRFYLPYPTAAATRIVTAGTWRARAVKNPRLSGATSKEIAIEERVSAPERVRRAVMEARAHHAIPSSLTPALDTLADDRADLGECDYGDPSPDRLCRRGDPGATRTLVVLGDSHGRMWIPAFERIGRTKGWAAYYLVKPQCTAAHVLVGKIPGGEPWPECSDFHTWAAAKVAELQPDLAVVATALPANGVYVDGQHVTDDAAVAAEYKAGMRRLFRSLLPNSGRVLLLADVPKRRADPGPCLRNAHNDLGDCLTVPNAHSAFITRKAIEAARQVGVPVVDPTMWTCWDGVCPAVIGSTVLYRDVGHLTTTYTRQLAEPVARALDIWH